jgi:hypothetical protein
VQRFYETPEGLSSGSNTLFEFIPRCPESRDFRFTPTGSGDFKFKGHSKRKTKSLRQKRILFKAILEYAGKSDKH